MLTLCATTMAQTTFSGPVRYVKTNGSYANDGTSWAQAKNNLQDAIESLHDYMTCLLYTSPSPRDRQKSRMPSSA